MTTATITSFEIDEITVSIGDKIVIDGEIRTVTAIKGRWVSLDNRHNISRADAADARSEYLEDEETLGDELENEEDVEAEEGHDIVKPEYRQRYQRTVSSNGNRTYDCGDQLASSLRGVTPTMLNSIIAALLPEKAYRWNRLNAGQISMNSRVALRTAIKNGRITLDDVIAQLS